MVGFSECPKIKKVLKESAIHSHYIHADGALAGTYLALLEKEPRFDFEQGIDSIAISGHKFIGSPIPCGVVIVKKNYRDRIGQTIPYIGTLDTTITGSRNGHSPVFLWHAINKLGREGLKARALKCFEVAEYALEEMKKLGIKAWKNPNAITIIFPKPAEEICIKWQLASDGEFSHIICMPGVTKEKIDEFLKDL